MAHRRRAWLAVVLLALGCGDRAVESGTPSADAGETPWPVTAFPALPESMSDVPEARIELGHLLFFDPILSVDKQTACATCHSEQWGMGDGLARAVGHGAGLLAGPSRRGPNRLRRNSPAIYNLAFRSTLLWDGRADSLEEQALMPILDPQEMGSDRESVLTDLTDVPEYVERFAEAFPEDPVVSIDNLTSALAAYQRTFVSNRSSYDAYASGRSGVMTDDEVEGMFRFAELGCDGCHTPPLFESETFADRNIPEVDGIVDHGLEEVTGREEDRGKFRAVTLRNVAFSEPYFHNGTEFSLKEAIRHELEQGRLPYTEEDLRLIAAFVDSALRDSSNRAVRPASVPSGLPIPEDPPGSR